MEIISWGHRGEDDPRQRPRPPAKAKLAINQRAQEQAIAAWEQAQKAGRAVAISVQFRARNEFGALQINTRHYLIYTERGNAIWCHDENSNRVW
jgi:hypothetical protein